jgi:hypothetical protein
VLDSVVSASNAHNAICFFDCCTSVCALRKYHLIQGLKLFTVQDQRSELVKSIEQFIEMHLTFGLKVHEM